MSCDLSAWSDVRETQGFRAREPFTPPFSHCQVNHLLRPWRAGDGSRGKVTMRSYARFSLLALTVVGFQSTGFAQQGAELTSASKEAAPAQAASAAEQPEFTAGETPAEFRKIWGYIFYAPGVFLYEYGP